MTTFNKNQTIKSTSLLSNTIIRSYVNPLWYKLKQNGDILILKKFSITLTIKINPEN